VGNARSKTSIKWPHRSKKGPISASKVGHGPYDIFIYAIITGPVKPDDSIYFLLGESGVKACDPDPLQGVVVNM
jgi:hypothetical protein